MPDPDDVLDALNSYIDEHPEPFAAAPDLVERLECSRRSALDSLRLLEAAGRVESRKVGRARVFWPTMPPAEPPAESAPSGDSPPAAPPAEPKTSEMPPAEPPAEPGGLDAVDFPASRDRDDCEAAIRAARDYIREHGKATMREIVREVMPDHSVGYDVPELQEGDRYRGAWWRRVVKPGLEALEDVEKPPKGGSEWRYTG